MNAIHIGIVGCGPWGLAVLERIIFHFSLEKNQRFQVKLHIIEPNNPGVGVYSDQLPECLLLNTECSQIDLFGSKYLEIGAVFDHPAFSFFEWLEANKYRINDYGVLREVRATDYLPRKWLGRYLHWVFQSLVAHLPNNISYIHHMTKAINVHKKFGKEVIELDDKGMLEVDFIFLTIGHAESVKFESNPHEKFDKNKPLSPFPCDLVNSTIGRNEKVLILGMGLTAIDIVSYLTIGRGGSFRRCMNGSLEYIPSGNEPQILISSRSGLPYLSRPLKVSDIAGVYSPLILTKEKIDELRKRTQKINFRDDILPLLWQEMKIMYDKVYSSLPLQDKGCLHDHSFNPEILFWGCQHEFPDSKSYEEGILEQLEYDIKESKKESGSAIKDALELIRILRTLIRYSVDFDGLSESSFIDFRTNILPLLYRAVVGPPYHKTEELHALMKGKILRYSVGPNPNIQFNQDLNKWTVQSTKLRNPKKEEVDYVIMGHISSNNFKSTSSKLLQNLFARGRVKESSPLGLGSGIEISTSFNPINCQDEIEDTVYVLGLLTDGKRNMNLYIPSPRSRIQAFLDADACVIELIRKATKVI